MTTTTAAPLTATDARRLTARLRDALAVADDLIVAAYLGRAWEALGHASWEAYCAAELPELRGLRLAPARRLARIAALRAAGASLRAIAAGAGCSTDTAHRGVRTLDSQPEVITGTDGKRRAAVTGPRPTSARPFTDRLVALLAEAGPMTCAEVCRRTRRHHGATSSALHRLAATGRIVYTPPARRGLHGLYSAPERNPR